MSYKKSLLFYLNLQTRKQVLILCDGKINGRVCISLLRQYIVTLGHGTHLHMHFSTWVVSLSLSPTNSQSLLTPLSCPRILSPSVALGDWYHSCVNTAKSCHAHVQEKFGHLYTICNLLSCWSYLIQSRTSLCCPVQSKTSLIVFHVDDGGFIIALLRQVYSYRLQHLTQELDLETKSSTLCLHALMAGYLAFNMSLHH